jgi:hypothetical protein
MTERKKTTMGGNVITLLGPELKVGERAPNFSVRTTELYQVTLDDYRGKRKLVSVAPSPSSAGRSRPTGSPSSSFRTTSTPPSAWLTACSSRSSAS